MWESGRLCQPPVLSQGVPISQCDFRGLLPFSSLVARRQSSLTSEHKVLPARETKCVSLGCSLAIKQSPPSLPTVTTCFVLALFSSSRGGVKVGYTVEDVNLCSILDAPSCSGPPQSSSPSLKWEQLFSWAWSLRAQ